jgi:hypothetical protein
MRSMIILLLVVLVPLAAVWWSDRRRVRRRRYGHAGAHDPSAPAAPPGDGFTPANNQWGGPVG